MTWHRYFRLADPAGWESALELEYEQEQKLNLKLKEEIHMTFNISMLKNSRFLTKDDCGNGIVTTISSIVCTNVAPDGENPDEKWTVHFTEENIKPLVLNTTNGEAIAEICGSDDGDAWTGKRIELYNDPNVSFAGKRTGGIRVRKPAEASVPAPADDISF